ncbi:MAG: type VI secretion system baseplate subunit TssE [Planctomycetota bacterium]|jgi:type VI secretion system protein ImpF|nr:type VI secretion system baseplate subunit TssE [Planctomycetota bacterium]
MPDIFSHRAEQKVAETELLPCLLDRLTDLEPHREGEATERRVASLRQYRESILRDLQWLLGSRSLFNRADDLAAAPRAVQESVLNFGMRDLTGQTIAGRRREQLTNCLREALTRFEPRIMPDTLAVKITTHDDDERVPATSLRLDLRGTLFALPVPEELVFRTDLDLETGAIKNG